jgi:adenylylsulfate kinase-like enzyme/ubiquinone/menaquinone biosynthesis C-methylase UbiE
LKRGRVIWISGLSSSGKSTVARILLDCLREKELNPLLLDGDDLRRALSSESTGYTKKERVELSKVYFNIACYLASQGFTVILAAISMFEEVREWLDIANADVEEIFLDVPQKIRLERDSKSKSIYGKGFHPELYDIPSTPSLKINNYGQTKPSDAAKQIQDFILGNWLINEDFGRREHWKSYYSQTNAPTEPSGYAKFVIDSNILKSPLLEIGCGNGRDAKYFLEHSYSYTGIDASNEAISLCKSTINDNNAIFISGNAATALLNLSQVYNSVYMRFCLHAMTDNEERLLFEALPKVLLPGGSLCIECRSINDINAKQGEYISHAERRKGHYRRFIDPYMLESRLLKSGFRVLSLTESRGFAPQSYEDPIVIRCESIRA